MFNRLFRSTKRWISNSLENALEEAYQRALTIKKIEDEHFKGQKISFQNCDYGESVWAYFQSELKSNLRVIKVKINQFKTNKSIHTFLSSKSKNSHYNYNHSGDYNFEYEQEIILEKLNFIDQILDKYNADYYETSSVKIDSNSPNQNINNNPSLAKQKNIQKQDKNDNNFESSLETVSDKTSVLPRSFLRTIDRIKQEIDPKSSESEQDVLNKFRKSKYKTAISIKFLLLLIIVPLLVHNVAKIALGKVFIDPYFSRHEEIVFINQDLQEEALIELKNFEENLNLKVMLGIIPELSIEEKEHEIKAKAQELGEEYRRESANAIKNIFADVFSLIAFGIVIYFSKRELQILKSFIDETIYGLSDSAKAFLIILFTDMFVGFHSPHGWEVILESISRHFGLPENRDFNFLFIATFPVILDTVLKYWIFRYLNRISPSAVATYKNMNES
ncbi:proton extrusion protein PcxA [Cyanobacterium aponinum AL20118]|uniref:Proton extrusion protein PxcA n=1 Tax=Cyanobacterium aponinum AL20115 TaxID=3090662 RepID=A0AAF0ZHM2_9CHRO|nr:proton extrusion protein PcxA [Cyanobacterium aponinum]MBD2393472.1 proton extrusion protein PcxA [Cyanobacterium aponinum FACHB-4101]WPF89509.1 proton extrusion protein PcxA [Cyanobacterium aponinum AL20115]